MDVLTDEIESLEAILMDDVKIVKNEQTNFPELIEITVLPTVGEEVERQYVCITLQVMPTQKYPDTKPNFKLRNPRGLDDCSINTIEKAVVQKLDNSLGQPVIFDLIDLIRELLTASNVPSGQCVICLFNFQEGDEFTKTICYHYLHSHCLACHLKAAQKNYDEELEKLPAWQRYETKPFQALCPVCREPISISASTLENAKIPDDILNAPNFVLTNEIKTLQKQMAKLYSHQKSRGGIIDLNAEEYHIISLENGDEDNNDNSKTVTPTVEESIQLTTTSLSSCSMVASSGVEPPAATTQSSPQRYNRNNNYRGGNRHHNHNRHNHHGHRSGGNHYSHNNNNSSSNNDKSSNSNNNNNNGASSAGGGGGGSGAVNDVGNGGGGSSGGGGVGRGRHRRGHNNHHYHHHHHHNRDNSHGVDHSQQQQQQSAAPVQSPCGSNTR